MNALIANIPLFLLFVGIIYQPVLWQKNSASLSPLQKNNVSRFAFPFLPQSRNTHYWGVCILFGCERLLCESCDELMTCPECNPACLLAETDSIPFISLNYQIKKVLNFYRLKEKKEKKP